jgi:nucleoid DNA-binding protein
MGKSDLINLVAKKAKLSTEEARKVIDIVLECIIQGVKDTQSVKIIGFGLFKTSHYPAHQVRNPRTNEIIITPASNRISFKAGEKFKAAVNPIQQEKTQKKKTKK